jgi:colanic acid/amylovoran biosynthesis glycosyltransferase
MLARPLLWKKSNIPLLYLFLSWMMPDKVEVIASRNCLVFRDKLLLPSEGFIKTHYQAFDSLQPVFVANQFGWRADELDGPKVSTSIGPLGRFLFKQTGRMDLSSLAAFAPVAIHAHFGRGGALALPIARSLGLPLYVTYHGGDATKKTHRRKRVLPTIYQRRLNELKAYASGFLCVSEFVAKQLRDQGFPEEKLITHYIGINCNDLSVPRQREGRFLFAGRLTGKKGVDILLAAIRHLQDSGVRVPQLDIAGSGPDEAKLRAAANGLDTVRFLGWQTPDQMAKLMARAAAVVVPSRQADDGDCEGLPTVVLEAIRAGAPVLATRHAGIPEIIDDGVSGLLAPENDVPALAEMLQRAVAQKAGLPALTAAAQNRLKNNFNAAQQSRILQNILSS